MSDETLSSLKAVGTARVDDNFNVIIAQTWGSQLIGGVMREKTTFVVVSVMTMCAFVALLPHVPRYYRATAMVAISLPAQDTSPDAPYVPTGPLDEGMIHTQVKILKSWALSAEVVSKLNLSNDPELNPGRFDSGFEWKRWVNQYLDPNPVRSDAQYDVVTALQRSLSVEQDRKGYTIDVTVSMRNPVRASQIANAVVDVYLQNQGKARRAVVEQRIAGLGQRYAILQDKARRSKAALQSYIAGNRLLDPAWNASAERQLVALSEELAKVVVSGSETEARARALVEMARNGTADSAPEVLNSSIIRALKERMLNTTGRIGTLEVEIAAIRKDMGAETDRIVRSVQSQAAVASVREARIRMEIDRIQASLAERAKLEVRLSDLTKESVADELVLSEAAARYKAQTYAAKMAAAQVEVISAAQAPTKPSFPQVPLFAVGAAIASLITGFMASLVSSAITLSRNVRHHRDRFV